MAFMKYSHFSVLCRAFKVFRSVSSVRSIQFPSPWSRHDVLMSTAASRQPSTANRRSNLMAQFEQIKSQHPNYILLFQVGDFYELYGDDASEVTSKTPLRLTRKNNTFMAGFPTKALSEWQRLLVEAGFQLAICDQNPAPKTDKGEKVYLLGRSVVKLVTPGTLVEPLSNHANYLLCINPGPSNTVGLAWVDISTAEFSVTSTEGQNIEEDIERICPSEILLPEDVIMAVEAGTSVGPSSSPCLGELVKCSALKESHLTTIPQSWYQPQLLDPGLHSLDVSKYISQENFSTLETSAATALLRFVMHTQRSVVPFLSPIARYSHHQHMAIDPNTRRALELVTPLYSNTKKTTLLGCMDGTVTAAGGRLLKARLSSPLTSIPDINKRLDAVEVFRNEVFHCEMVVGMLKKCQDLERILQKVATSSANISDLLAIKTTLALAADIMAYIKEHLPNCLVLDLEGFVDLSSLVQELDNALCDVTHGDYITAGYSEKVDALRQDIQNNEEQLTLFIASLHSSHPGLPKMTIVSHKGYIRVLEVTKSQSSKMEKCPELIRIDGTQSKVRFSNLQLQKLNAELQRLEHSYSTAQSELFKSLCENVMGEAESIKSTALVLAHLDVSTSLGALAMERAYCRPELREEPVFKVGGATHPVISSVGLGTFVSNDCIMDDHRLWVVTGPNMGGKSTFLRQNALLAVLAQTGSFVPAENATLGVVDRLFARVGASDNIARHMSTFHMEMTETANILSNATDRSFVVLDEIGRGTGTSEGLAIAQAVIEYLHNNIGCRSLVATHFHQLSGLAQAHPNIGCYKLVAHSNQNGIVFTYKIEAGYVERSFATDVARLAGIPMEAVRRAEELLADIS